MSRRKLIVAIFVFIAVLSVCAGILIDLYFSKRNPTTPMPQQGKIYSVISNKRRVYLNRPQLIIFYLPVVNFFVSFAAIGYLGVRWKLLEVPVRQPKFELPQTKKKQSDKKQE
ncbi:MAG TPA: hypothetical protein VIG25_22760 [Pyrinomonadaceae bacterium]